MSDSQLQAFIETARKDESIQNKLREARTPDHVAEVAKEYGFEVTTKELGFLSKNELENISGGFSMMETGCYD